MPTNYRGQEAPSAYQREEMPDDFCVGDVDPAGELAHGYLGGVVELPGKTKSSKRRGGQATEG